VRQVPATLNTAPDSSLARRSSRDVPVSLGAGLGGAIMVDGNCPKPCVEGLAIAFQK
jgi:hypothetical protein